jgi:NAD(P)-dependent dehydrogenase (short-subunit alcohol dehydrogenase family)
MQYFVTGATGFIGKRLVKTLLARRGAVVHFLLRPESEGKVPELLAYWGVGKSRAVPVYGDLTSKKLGVAADDVKALKGQVDHFYHLAAVYDLKADEESQVRTNIEGTRSAVEFAKAIDAKHFHHVSSIAAAGLYEGVFREDMFEEAEGLDHPYFMTKHESEKIVRKEGKVPWTVYRPAMVVGDSTTGEMDKVDGPYYFFKLIQRMRQILPPWMPSVGLEGGRVNIVPVDFVVAALDHISHHFHASGKCYHLVDPVGYRVGDVLDIFSKAAHAPKMNLFVNAALLGFIPKSVKKGLMALAPVRRVYKAVMNDLGVPEDMMTFVNYPTRFDRRETDAALKGSGIECPNLHDYAWRLWDYWERHLDPALFIDRSLRGTVGGKVVLVTGGSSGIGLAAACKFAQAGAVTLICARDADKLAEAVKEIKAYAGKDAIVHCYSVDIADEASCAEFIKTLTEEHGGVDFLINNAGRSIRRAIESSYDRFHDFERTMQLNYFGCLRVTMGLLPGMVAKKKGHVVNISSIGVLTNAPRFSAYVASKAALDAWTRCASSEYADLGITGELLHAVAPRVAQIVMNTSFRMFPDSEAAKGEKGGKPQLSAEAVAMQQMMRGIHF